MEITVNKKKIVIAHDDRFIKVSIKHIPIFLMMLQKHFNPYSYNESYGYHQVIKSDNENTIIVKHGGLRIKYSISQCEDGTRLYGRNQDNYLLVTEELVNKLIIALSNVYEEAIKN